MEVEEEIIEEKEDDDSEGEEEEIVEIDLREAEELFDKNCALR
jgi:hypothetical protein